MSCTAKPVVIPTWSVPSLEKAKITYYCNTHNSNSNSGPDCAGRGLAELCAVVLTITQARRNWSHCVVCQSALSLLVFARFGDEGGKPKKS